MANKRVESNKEICQAQVTQQNDDKAEVKDKKLSQKMEIRMRLQQFKDLYEMEAKNMRIPDGYRLFLTGKFRQYYHKTPPLHACAIAFESGAKWLIFHKRQQIIQRQNIAELRQGTALNPRLLETIATIVEESEIKNGPLPAPKAISKTHRGHDDYSYEVDKTILDNFNRMLKREDINPPENLQRALGEFFGMMINELPIHEACGVAFTAGIIYQKNHRKLTG